MNRNVFMNYIPMKKSALPKESTRIFIMENKHLPLFRGSQCVTNFDTVTLRWQLHFFKINKYKLHPEEIIGLHGSLS